jgi:hypothetical protein
LLLFVLAYARKLLNYIIILIKSPPSTLLRL